MLDQNRVVINAIGITIIINELFLMAECISSIIYVILTAMNDLELRQDVYSGKCTSHIVVKRMCQCIHESILRNLDIG